MRNASMHEHRRGGREALVPPDNNSSLRRFILFMVNRLRPIRRVYACNYLRTKLFKIYESEPEHRGQCHVKEATEKFRAKVFLLISFASFENFTKKCWLWQNQNYMSLHLVLLRSVYRFYVQEIRSQKNSKEFFIPANNKCFQYVIGRWVIYSNLKFKLNFAQNILMHFTFLP